MVAFNSGVIRGSFGDGDVPLITAVTSSVIKAVKPYSLSVPRMHYRRRRASSADSKNRFCLTKKTGRPASERDNLERDGGFFRCSRDGIDQDPGRKISERPYSPKDPPPPVPLRVTELGLCGV